MRFDLYAIIIIRKLSINLSTVRMWNAFLIYYVRVSIVISLSALLIILRNFSYKLCTIKTLNSRIRIDQVYLGS